MYFVSNNAAVSPVFLDLDDDGDVDVDGAAGFGSSKSIAASSLARVTVWAKFSTFRNADVPKLSTHVAFKAEFVREFVRKEDIMGDMTLGRLWMCMVSIEKDRVFRLSVCMAMSSTLRMGIVRYFIMVDAQ